MVVSAKHRAPNDNPARYCEDAKSAIRLTSQLSGPRSFCLRITRGLIIPLVGLAVSDFTT
jgi:hypothetical protein